MKTYTGTRTSSDAVVTVNGWPLNPRLDLASKSPSGFEWGFGGSGPGQLALAILADFLQDDEEALAFYQEFKWRVIAGLQEQTWTLTGEQVTRTVDEIRAECR